MPISQAEFAQLVAESMATSTGPHHHHPPNTDRDYEGPEHRLRDEESMRHYQQYGYPGYQQHRHSNHKSERNNDDSNQHQSQYQPEDRYHNQHGADSENEEYPRAPVYENTYDEGNNNNNNNNNEQQSNQDEEEDSTDNSTYGGQVGNDNYDNYDQSAQYQPTSASQYDGEETRVYPARYITLASKGTRRIP